jgi:hypothetical protein
LFFINFITDHPEIFRKVLHNVFSEVENGKLLVKLKNSTIEVDGVLPFLVRRKKMSLFTTNNYKQIKEELSQTIEEFEAEIRKKPNQ